MRPLTKEQRRRLEARVLALRKRNVTYKEMAKRLKQPRSRIETAIRQLLRNGKISTVHIRQKDRSKEHKIIDLRLSDKSNKAIAGAVGLTVNALKRRLTALLETGQVQRRMGGRVATPLDKALTFWKDLASEDAQQFIKDNQERVPLAEQGRRWGCSGQRIRKIRLEMTMLYGAQIFVPKKPMISTGEFARRVGYATATIGHLCQLGVIRATRSGKRGHYRIAEELVREFDYIRGKRILAA